MALSDSPWRWLVLALASLSVFGSYYNYDSPSALNEPFMAYFTENHICLDKQACSLKFNLLYSVYSIPNIILPLFGGMFVDRMGHSLAILFFFMLICLGQFLFALGVSTAAYWLMLLGRTVFGFGGESLVVAVTTVLAVWFQGREVALAMGIQLAVSRLGSVVNNQLSPWVYNRFHQDLTFAMWFGMGVALCSLACTVVLVVWDGHAQQKEQEPDKADTLGDVLGPAGADDEEDAETDATLALARVHAAVGDTEVDDEDEVFSAADFQPTPDQLRSPERVDHTAARTPRDGAAAGARASQAVGVTVKGNGSPARAEVEEPSIFSAIGDFSYTYWLVTASCVMVYATILPFNNIAGAELQTKYHYRLVSADRLLSIPYLISACCSPVAGMLVDRYGQRASLLLWAAISLAIAHTLLAVLHAHAWFPLLAIGLAYTTYASAIWPSVPHVVPAEHLGTAYGVITSVQNGGLAIIPMLVGYIHDVSKGYIAVESFFAVLACGGVLVGILLLWEDARQGYVLNRSYHKGDQSAHGQDGDEEDETVPFAHAADPNVLEDREF